MRWAFEEIARGGSGIELIYSLALPIDVLRREDERNAVISAIAEAPCDAVWLKIENFGDDASGEKTAAYIAACRDFQGRGVPVIGDHLGGLPGLGALAFGAVGGIAHGVTMLQSFKAAGWRRPRIPGNGGPSRRVYIPHLDLLLKRDAAKALLGSSPRVRALCGCRDTHCRPEGPRDMIGRPARHPLYQRAREIEDLGATPESLRIPQYLDERVRRVCRTTWQRLPRLRIESSRCARAFSRSRLRLADSGRLWCIWQGSRVRNRARLHHGVAFRGASAATGRAERWARR